ncbi:MAG: ABC transporter substrate-binding protein [Pseudomonadota bacterium]
MRSLVGLLGAVFLVMGCSSPGAPQSTDNDRPMRIISLDYCADQFVLKFAERDQILAVSPHAGEDFSFMRDAALGVPSVRSSAEDVLALKPDLVVRAYGGGPGASALFERAGIPVLDVGWSPDMAAVRANTLRMATGLGQTQKGEALVAEMDARLAALSGSLDMTALYTTPGGVTPGPGGLVGEMMDLAGFENFETRPGWHPLPLERLAYGLPDVFVFAEFEGGAGPWSAARHSIFKSAMKASHVVEIEGAWTACGGWFIVEAVEVLAEQTIQ